MEGDKATARTAPFRMRQGPCWLHGSSTSPGSLKDRAIEATVPSQSLWKRKDVEGAGTADSRQLQVQQQVARLGNWEPWHPQAAPEPLG